MWPVPVKTLVGTLGTWIQKSFLKIQFLKLTYGPIINWYFICNEARTELYNKMDVQKEQFYVIALKND